MRTAVVVALKPIAGHVPHVVERVEQIGEQFGPIGPVKPLDQGVLGRIAW